MICADSENSVPARISNIERPETVSDNFWGQELNFTALQPLVEKRKQQRRTTDTIL